METIWCGIEDRKVSKGKCLYDKGGTQPNNLTCPQCSYFQSLFPAKSKSKYKSQKISKSKVDQKRALIEWEYHQRKPDSELLNMPIDFDQCARKMRIKYPGQAFDDDWMEIYSRVRELIIREVREVMPMPRNRPGKKRSSSLPKRKTLNRCLHVWMILLALFYEKWKGRRVTRDTMGYEKLINFSIQSKGLSEVWPPASVHRSIQIIMSKFLTDFHKNYSPDSLAERHLGDILPHAWLL